MRRQTGKIDRSASLIRQQRLNALGQNAHRADQADRPQKIKLRLRLHPARQADNADGLSKDTPVGCISSQQLEKTGSQKAPLKIRSCAGK